MKINTSMLMGFTLLIVGLFNCLNDSSIQVTTIVLINLGLFFMVSGLFEIKNYHNKKLYLVVIVAITGTFLVYNYIKLSTQSYQWNIPLDSMYASGMAVVTIWFAYEFTKKWELFKKNVKLLDYFLIAFILFYVGLTALIQL